MNHNDDTADALQGMYGIMIESAKELVSCWEKQIVNGDEGEVRIDLDMRNFSADVISKACFGSSYTDGRLIFQKLRALQRIMSSKSMLMGLPGLKYALSRLNFFFFFYPTNSIRDFLIFGNIREL